MEWLLGLAVLTIAGTAGLTWRAFVRAQERLRVEARQRAAAACGLEAMETGASGVVTGRRGALRVRLESVGTLRLTIDGIEPALQVVSAHLRWSPDAILRRGDVEVGDPFFDPDVVVVGPPVTVRGLFTAGARARARHVFAGDARVRIGGGALVAEFPAEGMYAPLDDRLRALIELAHLLEPGLPGEQRLAAVACEDPLSTVRATALDTLVSEAPESDLTRAALRRATRDIVSAIRLKAALALGDEGIPVLRALAEDGGIADADAAAAVTALGSHLVSARARQLLASADRNLRVPLARALLPLLAARGPAEMEEVAALLARRSGSDASILSPASAEIAVAAAEALAEARSPRAEAPLVAALASSVAGVALAATRGLGRVGTVRAVPALREAEDHRGDLRSAARQAIAAIQSRLTGARPGQVSLAGDAGQVSVVDAADGRVSLETDE